MPREDPTQLASRVIDATIRLYHGHFRKGRSLKLFYRAIRTRDARAFVVLRDDPMDFVAIEWQPEGRGSRFELWANIANRADAKNWRDDLRTMFPSLTFDIRTPDDPIALAQRMGFRTDA
ncbi:MAG: hypothetical protein V1723_02350 [Candidatus Uhrbacteria bacterium]